MHPSRIAVIIATISDLAFDARTPLIEDDQEAALSQLLKLIAYLVSVCQELKP